MNEWIDRWVNKITERRKTDSQINRWLHDENVMREIMYSSSQLLIDKME
jgi:hypothetical protein